MPTYSGVEWKAPITNPTNADVECHDCGEETDAADGFCFFCASSRIEIGNNGVGPCWESTETEKPTS